MSFVPGVYDDECNNLRESTKGALVLVMVLDGAKGTGFSVMALRELMPIVPKLLRIMATEIEGGMTTAGATSEGTLTTVKEF